MADDEDDSATSDDTERRLPRIDAVDTAAVAVLSLAALYPLFSFDFTLQHLFAFDMNVLLESVTPLFLLLPLPFAYVAVISCDRFRYEAFATLIAAPAVTLDIRFAPVAAGLVIGAVLVSYKTRSIYHGDNTGWTYFKATGSAVFILGITVALTTVMVYNDSPAFRDNVQGNLTDHAVDIALSTTALETGQNAALSGETGDLTAMTEQLSQQSINATEVIVFAAVAADGSFTQRQRTVLRDAFDTAQTRVPEEIGNQTETQLSGGHGGGMEDTTVESMVRPRVSNLISQFSAPSPATSAAIFLVAFSIVTLFKIPFRIFGAMYGLVLQRVRTFRS